MKKVLILTGEASGDLHGARVIRELKKLIPDLNVFGIGGEKFKAEEIELVSHIKDITVVGFSEVIPKFFRIRKVMKLIYKKMIDEHPDMCLLIDYPGFNLRFAKLAKNQGIKVVYYILPQVWAWGRWRIKSICRWIDKGISILPFEAEFYNAPNKIKFVGHPLLDIIPNIKYKIPNTNTIALLPGSRKDEIKRILPLMLKCVEFLPEFDFVIPVAPGIDKDWIEKLVGSLHSKIKIIDNNVYEVLSESKLALIASGTATLEACILGVPSIIIYRVSLFSYILGKLLIKIPYIGLPNIIADNEVMPEFIQFNANPAKIVETTHQILKNREKAVSALQKVKEKMGSPGTVQRVSQILYEILRD